MGQKPLIVLGVLLIIGAGAVYWALSRPESAGKDSVALTCQGCKNQFALSQDTYQQLLDDREYRADERSKEVWLQCPKCKQFQATVNQAQD